MEKTMQHEIRWVDDIGMFASDRSREDSCIHATDYCREKCYNAKLEKVFKLSSKDIRNDVYWKALNGDILLSTLKRRKKSIDRFRFQTRGETIKDFHDIDKIKDICIKNPQTIFWMPTRAWRDPLLFARINSELQDLTNIRILASMDPTNTTDEWEMVKSNGWSTMFFGDNGLTHTLNGDRVFKCPKTHKDLKGHCSICKAGCFNSKKRVDVHLKQH